MARFCWSGGRGPHSSEDSGRELYIAYDVWIAVEVVVVYQATLEEAAKMLDKVTEAENIESGSAIPQTGITQSV